MARASLDRAVEFTRARLAADGGVLATVALALVGVPAMLTQVIGATAATRTITVGGQAMEQIDPTLPQWLALLALTVAVLLGQLVLTRMTLSDGETVRQSLASAGRRLPILLGAQALAVIALGLVLLLVIALLALLAALGAAGMAVAAIGGVALLVVLLLVGARLLFLTPAVAEGGQGVVGSLRRAVATSRGLNGALLLTLVVTTVVTLVAMGAAQALVGLPVALAAGPRAGAIAGAATGGLVLSLATLVTVTLVVGLYRQATSTLDDRDVRSG